MQIEQYGKWTNIIYEDRSREWVPGHQTYKKIKRVGDGPEGIGRPYDLFENNITGWAHFNNGEWVEEFGYWYGNSFIKGKKVTILEFEIVSNPTITIKDIKQRRFNVIDRYAKAVKSKIQEIQDRKVFEVLNVEYSEDDK